jgi:hypothetical protein
MSKYLKSKSRDFYLIQCLRPGGVTLAEHRKDGRYWPLHPSYARRVRGMLEDAGMPHDHIDVDEEVEW